MSDTENPGELQPHVAARIQELATEATAMRVERGEPSGFAELGGIADAIGFMQATSQLPYPSSLRSDSDQERA
ncbi:MAG: hypothetical protein M3P40_10620 [Actinomycetota bacterium]|nr:hypothetical protein [Actinomycetota bacterium]